MMRFLLDFEQTNGVTGGVTKMLAGTDLINRFSICSHERVTDPSNLDLVWDPDNGIHIWE